MHLNWPSNATAIMAYSGATFAYIIPMTSIIYMLTRSLTNLTAQIQSYQLTNITYNAFFLFVFGAILAAFSVDLTFNIFQDFVN